MNFASFLCISVPVIFNGLLLFICIILLQCRAYAKALHYKEMEFEGALSKKTDANPVAVVEALIHINSQLHQHEVCGYYILLSSTYLFLHFNMYMSMCLCNIFICILKY